MKNLLIFVSFYLSVISRSSQRSTSADENYVAAVVESEVKPLETKFKEYAQIITEAAEKDVDIILFPEEDLTAMLDIPINGTLLTSPIPALRPDLYSEPLVQMSEAARNNSIYVVVNFHELLDCTRDTHEQCPETKLYLFNTNVVFDRYGAVILRYRKNNLFEEPGFTQSFEPGVGKFDTDFGVTFGVIICYDILNQVPAMQAVGQNLRNILSSANWFSEMPFLTSVQAYEAFAYGMDVNLLVSGLSNATDYATGSGIFSGISGAMVSYITGVPTAKLLISKVPKVPGTSNFQRTGPVRQNPASLDKLITITDPSLLTHITKVLVPGYQEFTLVHNDVTCRFQIVMREKNGEQSYQYRAGAFSGVAYIPKGNVTLVTRDCAVFTCMNGSIETCGKRFIQYTKNSTAIFEDLFIEGTIPTPTFNSKIDAYDSNFFPSTLDVSLLPLEPEDFDYFVEEKENKTIHSFSLKNSDAELYTFALWGRQFEKDDVFTPPMEVKVNTIEKKDEKKVDINGNENEKVESQEDNDAGIVQNLKSFENM